MKPGGDEFLRQEHKALTLIGMSGVGKSYLARRLADWGWYNYSCDDLIGSEYLVVDNMADLSAFVGQIGDPDKGGIPLDEFRKRQKQYYDAECAVLRDTAKGLAAAKDAGHAHFVNDSAGSLCEVEDEDLLAQVGAQTVFVYLKVRQSDHAEILERAIKYPKPLYFPPAFFDERLAAYLTQFNLESANEIDPAAFLSWVFPRLFQARLPKYQRLADRYGVTLSAGDITNVDSEEAFIEKIAQALDEQNG